jgi:hypothetical protein
MHGISKDKIIQSGQTVTVQCILKGGNPLGKIIWYKGRKSILNSIDHFLQENLGNELLVSESMIDSNGTSVISGVNFIATSSDNNLSLTCQGQVDNFQQKLASFILNITCKKLENIRNRFLFFYFILIIVLPEEIMIIDNLILSNLSFDNDNSRIFECRTSPSNPQLQLTVFRQTKDGQKYFDIQYKTSSTYINGINSIQFMVNY